MSSARALVLGAVLGASIVLIPLSHLLGWAALMIAATALGVVGWRTPALRGPLAIGLAFRAVSALSHVYVRPLPASGQDAVRFEQMGWLLASEGLLAVLGRLGSVEHVYAWIIGVLYALTDRSPLMIQMLNVLFGTLVVCNVFALARLLWGPNAARRAAWVMAVFPTAVLFSAVILRETFVVYPLSLGVLFFARWYVTGARGLLVGAFLSFAVVLAFHVFVVPVILAALVLVIVRWTSSLRGRSRRVAVLAASFAVSLLALGAAAVLASGRFADLEFLLLSGLQIQHAVTSVERAGYLEWLMVTSLWDVPWQAPIRVAYFLLMPFPWRVTAVVDLVGLVDALLYAWLLWLLFRSRRSIWRNAPARASLLVAFASIFVFGVVVSNYGTGIRHRAKVAPILIAVAAGAMAGTPRNDGRQRAPAMAATGASS